MLLEGREIHEKLWFSALSRLLKKVTFTERGCWIYPADEKHYGSTHIGRTLQMGTHRISYLWFNGQIPDGMYVLHKCDVKQCCNPSHLFLGTASDNLLDAAAKGRHYNTKKKTCPQGHELTGFIKRKNGRKQRYCRICDNQRKKDAYRNRNRQGTKSKD